LRGDKKELSIRRDTRPGFRSSGVAVPRRRCAPVTHQDQGSRAGGATKAPPVRGPWRLCRPRKPLVPDGVHEKQVQNPWLPCGSNPCVAHRRGASSLCWRPSWDEREGCTPRGLFFTLHRASTAVWPRKNYSCHFVDDLLQGGDEGQKDHLRHPCPEPPFASSRLRVRKLFNEAWAVFPMGFSVPSVPLW